MSGWTENGISGSGEPPEVVNAYSGSLVILGGSEGVFDEMKEARQHYPNADLMAINLTFCSFKQMILDKQIHIEHWCSVHPEFFAIKNLYTGKFTQSHCPTDGKNVDHVWKIANNGTSGLFAVRIGLAMGYQRIVLCGVPLENKPHFFDCPGTELRWPEDQATEMAWKYAIRDEFKGKVRSTSGRTRQWLGGPEKVVSCGV